MQAPNLKECWHYFLWVRKTVQSSQKAFYLAIKTPHNVPSVEVCVGLHVMQNKGTQDGSSRRPEVWECCHLPHVFPSPRSSIRSLRQVLFPFHRWICWGAGKLIGLARAKQPEMMEPQLPQTQTPALNFLDPLCVQPSSFQIGLFIY